VAFLSAFAETSENSEAWVPNRNLTYFTYLFHTGDGKTKELDYEVFYNCALRECNEPGKVWLFYRADHRIYGCQQKEFTYSDEFFHDSVPAAPLSELHEALKKISFEKFKYTKEDEDRGAGHFDFKDAMHSFSSEGLKNPEMAKLHALILGYVDKVAPAPKRKKTTRTIEGGNVAALDVTWEELFRDPEKLDGKRIRMTGYYTGAFESSSFSPDEETNKDGKKSLWLNSTRKGGFPIKGFVTVEGTYRVGRGGHMGMSFGEIERVTKIAPLEKAVDTSVLPETSVSPDKTLPSLRSDLGDPQGSPLQRNALAPFDDASDNTLFVSSCLRVNPLITKH